MTEIEIPHEWHPRSYQLKLWSALEHGCKRAVAVWHRRAGKDSLSLNWTACSAFLRVGVYWHMAPTQRQVRKIVWDNIDGQGRRVIDQVWPEPLRQSTRDQEMQITLKNGSIWQCVGSDNYDSLVGSNPIGVVFSEYSLADPAAWDYVRPILAENGGWALFIYTPRGPNHGKDLYDTAINDPDWFAELLTVKDTGAIPLTAVDDERRAGMSEAMIEQEFFCAFTGIVDGSYYGKLIQQARNEKRLTRVPCETSEPVITAWDLGTGDDTAIWFVQQVGLEVRVIDYYEHRGVGIEHYAQVLNDKGYTYKEHIMPHDAGHKQLATGKSISSQLQQLGVRPCRVLPREQKLSNEVGIQAVRNLLPKCYFDYDKCKDGIKYLELYKRDYDDKRKVFKDTPCHDYTSHAADAFRYLAMGLKPARMMQPMRTQRANTDYDVMSL